MPPSCPGAAAVTSVYDTLLPLSPHLPPSPADQMPGGPGAPLPTWTRRLLPGDQTGTGGSSGEASGGGRGPRRRVPPASFLVDALFSVVFSPFFRPPAVSTAPSAPATRSAVIGWAAGPTPDKAPGSRIEPLQDWQDMVGAASFPPQINLTRGSLKPSVSPAGSPQRGWTLPTERPVLLCDLSLSAHGDTDPQQHGVTPSRR